MHTLCTYYAYKLYTVASHWFAPSNPRGAAKEVACHGDIKPGFAEAIGKMPAVAKVTAVNADHREILRPLHKEAFDQRQDAIHVEAEQRAQDPALGIGCFDQGKGRAGFQDAGDFIREDLLLGGVEGFQTKAADHKIGGFFGKVAFQSVYFKMSDFFAAGFMQAFNGFQMHGVGNVDGGDFGDAGMGAQKMRPKFASARHEVNALRAGQICFGQIPDAFTTPAPDEPKRGKGAPGAIGATAIVKNLFHIGGIVNIVAQNRELHTRDTECCAGYGLVPVSASRGGAAPVLRTPPEYFAQDEKVLA